MPNSPRVTAAIKEAADELMGLSDEEFQARLDATKGTDLYHALRYAFDPNYKLEDECK
jgi:hypothetical protein